MLRDMKLYLVRHGKAKSVAEDPFRPLTDDGVNEARKLADYLKRIKAKIKKIYHSGKLRARQTAEIIAEKLGAELKSADGLNPGDEPWIWAARLSEIDEDIMLIGHLPHLERLAALLLVDDPDSGIIQLKTCGLAILERDEIGQWRLMLLISPDSLP